MKNSRCSLFPAAPYLGQKRRRRHRFYHIAVDDAVAAGIHDLPCGGIGHHDAGHTRVAAPDGHAEIHAAAAHQALVDGEDIEGLLLQQLAQLAPTTDYRSKATIAFTKLLRAELNNQNKQKSPPVSFLSE